MACILCNSENVFYVQTIDTAILINAWRSGLDISVAADFGSVRQIQLLECRECGIQYFVPSTIAGTEGLYAQLSRLEWYYMPRKWEHSVAVQDLQGCRKIIEVGCGSGEFIARAFSEASLAVEGIELNSNAVQAAQRRGLPVQLLNLHELAEISAGQYDAVCSFQVLEHVPDPKQFLLDLCCLLKPGGKLILGIPNGDSFLKRQFNLLDMPPHHMTRWSPRAVARLPASFPLRVLQLRFEPLAAYHVQGYVNARFPVPSDTVLPIRLSRLAANRVLAEILKVTRLRQLLRGQTLYVSCQRL